VGGEIKWGSATDLEQAKRDSWAEAYRFLIGLEYTDAGIARARPRFPGSFELDLAPKAQEGALGADY
jgi:hypothetical protein